MSPRQKIIKPEMPLSHQDNKLHKALNTPIYS